MPPLPSSRISSYCLIRVPGTRSTPGSVVPSSPKLLTNPPCDGIGGNGIAVDIGAEKPPGRGVMGPTPNCVPTGGFPRSSCPTSEILTSLARRRLGRLVSLLGLHRHDRADNETHPTDDQDQHRQRVPQRRLLE